MYWCTLNDLAHEDRTQIYTSHDRDLVPCFSTPSRFRGSLTGSTPSVLVEENAVSQKAALIHRFEPSPRPRNVLGRPPR
ncbi:hypothetical protein GQ602_006934 [Ophiocordyceps camponoti-floridani]|uniref:Uncharacterized protein n=1 Tax=Ophiocordyceps camponoti-floridani TaxID=2030778 RepID=A0A8H4Q0L2_9HYPO|nr:hypothetical protein GQ602_006934 [Ophiocordyceps camponoti-floridani]